MQWGCLPGPGRPLAPPAKRARQFESMPRRAVAGVLARLPPAPSRSKGTHLQFGRGGVNIGEPKSLGAGGRLCRAGRRHRLDEQVVGFYQVNPGGLRFWCWRCNKGFSKASLGVGERAPGWPHTPAGPAAAGTGDSPLGQRPPLLRTWIRPGVRAAASKNWRKAGGRSATTYWQCVVAAHPSRPSQSAGGGGSWEAPITSLSPAAPAGLRGATGGQSAAPQRPCGCTPGCMGVVR